MKPVDLKLHALDREGLEVVSAHMQDACVCRSQMTYLPQRRSFALHALRYDWIGAKHGLDERVGSALRFDRVMKVSSLGFEGDPDKVRSLLGLLFQKTDEPSGFVLLTFSDGATVKLEVECLEAELTDTGPRKTACDCEGHRLSIYTES
jgi:hypothetical protein